jgi:uncharacterized protein
LSVPNVRKERRWLRILKRIVITAVISLIVLIYGVVPYLLARLITSAGTRPIDRALTETPADFGATFKDVTFQTTDGVTIKGWYLPSRDRTVTIVYSHGLFRSRRELLERAIGLWKLGYGALLYDARNHGESGPAMVTLGYNERLDAEAAVRFLKDEIVTSDRIVLFGISMGAGAALLAAAETPEVVAAISDSSFLSFKDTTDHHVSLLFRLPAFPIANEIRFYIERRADFDGGKLDALSAVRSMGERPIFFIAGARDPRMPPSIAETLLRASVSPKSDILVADGPNSQIHGHAYQTDPARYIDNVDRFLKSAVP